MKKRAFGTHDIAKMCHVTPPTIGRWISEGKLPSFKTGGGHRRVWDNDLCDFLSAHNIPLPDTLNGSNQISSSQTEEKKHLSLLIVDDEFEMRRFLRRVVKKSFPHIQVYDAEDGFEAGHKIVSIKPSIIILDILLPGVDGFKVCKTVRGDKKLKETVILAMTGYCSEESRENIMKAGADAFLPKPFNAEELIKTLEKILEPLKESQTSLR